VSLPSYPTIIPPYRQTALSALQHAMDRIHARYGARVLSRGTLASLH